MIAVTVSAMLLQSVPSMNARSRHHRRQSAGHVPVECVTVPLITTYRAIQTALGLRAAIPISAAGKPSRIVSRMSKSTRVWHHFFGISRDTPRPIRTGRNDSFHYIGVPRGSCRISAVSGARGWVRMTSTVSVRTFTDADVSRKKSDLSAGKNEWFFAFIPGGTWYGVSLAYFGQPIHVHWKA
jgi:hypothetical protein